MSNLNFDAAEIKAWMSSGVSRSKASFTLSEIREAPAGVVGDFDTSSYVGRIICWYAGFYEFEILSIKDDRRVLFRHGEESTIDSPALQEALSEFFAVLEKQ